MTATVRTQRPRLTQAERVEAMRERLLEATVELLAKNGWAKLSTNDVVRRARVSRGALAHHFPTKALLVRAAAERLVERRVEEFEAAFAKLDPSRRTVDHALDVLWSFFQGPTFAAVLELTVAARTDPELRRVFADAPETIVNAIYDVFAEFFPEAAASPIAPEVLRAGFALLSGMALQYVVDRDRQGHHAELLAWIKSMARLLIGPQSA